MDTAAAFLATLDRGIFLLVNRTLQNPVLDLLMPVLSDKRAGLLAAAVVIPCLLVRYGRRAWPITILALLAIGMSDAGATLLKHAVQRARPCHVVSGVRLLAGCTLSSAMPSNHASNMFAVAGTLAPLLAGWRWVAVVLAVGVAYSRLYLGVHYPSDVLVGAVWGGAVGLTLALAARRVLPAAWVTFTRTAPDPPKGPSDAGAVRQE